MQLLAAFLWGAVLAASIAAAVNGLAQTWIAAASSESAARTMAPMLAAPAIEELAKAAALLVVMAVWRRDIAGAVDGMVYGALIGIGFAVSENVLYLTLASLQGGYAGLLRGAYLRAIVYGGNHAAFTATTGAAFGYARRSASRAASVLVALLGLGAAVAQHVIWNSVAAEAIEQLLCGASAAGAACRPAPSGWSLYLAVPLIVALFIGPGVMILLALAAMARDPDARRSQGANA